MPFQFFLISPAVRARAFYFLRLLFCFLTPLGCMETFQAIPSNGKMTVSWAANREKMVNSTGGGYRVYYSETPGFQESRAKFVDVPYVSGSGAPTSVTITSLFPTTYYVKVAAYGAPSGGSVIYSSASPEASLEVGKASAKPRIENVVVPSLKPLSAEEMKVDLRKAPHRRDEILVRFHKRINSSMAKESVRALGGAKSELLKYGNPALSPMHKVKLEPGVGVEEALKRARLDSSIEYAQPNFIYKKFATPNDPLLPSLWAVRNSAQVVASPGADEADVSNNPGTIGLDIGLLAAWDVATDCSSVVIAVIDTGIRITHEDIAANIWTSATYPNGGYDFVDGDNDPQGLDGHGTHVAGTIAAIGNNGVGSTGVCWNARLMAVRVLDDDGSGTTADVAAGIDFAVAQGAKVINLSLGITSFDQALSDSVEAASDAGVILVAAAGNSATNNETSAVYPCNFNMEHVICVAAVDQKFALASYSNYGTTKVHIAAPGTNIASLWNGLVTDVEDALSSGWSTSGWGYRTDAQYGSISVLANPSNWNGTSATYANSADERAYKSFAVPNGDRATLSYYARFSLSLSGTGDFLNSGYRLGVGDPFAGGGSLFSPFGGSSANSYLPVSDNLNACLGATCTVGFQLVSDGSVSSTGFALTQFAIRVLDLDDSEYNMTSGTSMAAPHVSGLAALIWSINPDYTALDVINAMKSSGRSVSALATRTQTGKVIDAAAGVKYVAPPSGVNLTHD